MKKWISFLIVLMLSIPHLSSAMDEEFESYDSIVDQLSTTRTPSRKFYEPDPFDSILIHAGVGAAMSMTSLQFESESRTGLFQGVEVNFGIDLFSDVWMAEGSYINFGRSEVKTKLSKDEVEVNEFGMKLVYRPHINRFLRFRSTGGLAARYMSYFDNLNQKSLNYNTPAWAFSMGLEAKITSVFSFTAELAYRSSMITETIDENSVGAGLRLDAHF